MLLQTTTNPPSATPLIGKPDAAASPELLASNHWSSCKALA
ncbi:hypothetical protein [Moorena sp. SIO4G3]|nr:hypothetical protein [Moorena sp. SIO4G3]